MLDNLRAEEKSISLITDFTINNPDIQDYCKHLILYNLTVHDYKDISFGEWIVNLKGLSGLAYIPVSFTKNGISDKTNYSCECKKILITELIYVNVTYQICRILLRNHSLLKRILNGTDLYQLSLKSIQDDINNAEIAYNKAKTTTDNAAATLETRKAAVPGLKTEYEKAVKNAESIKMNFNTQRAMVNRSKTEYDETVKAAAAAYEIYEQYKQKADALLEEYNRVTSTTSSINIEYENARKSVDKILNDIDNAKDHIKKLEAFDDDSASVLNNAKLEYENAKAQYDEVIAAQQNAAANMPQVKDELDKCIADEEAKKKQWKMLLQMR